MKTVTARFRESDRAVYDAVLVGRKSVETRAATIKFRDLRAGDKIILICGSNKTEKIVRKSKIYKNLDELFDEVDFKKIAPFASSVGEAKRVYQTFPDYREKIAKWGIIALELS